MNYNLSLLHEVEFSKYQATFFRQEVWSYTGSLFYDFCFHVNIDYFNVLFRDIKPEQYKSNYLKIINKNLVVDLTRAIVSVFFKMSMKKRVQLLKSCLVKKFPELNDGVGFYLN